MKATIKRSELVRYPEEINLYFLYSYLWHLEIKRSGGKGFTNVTRHPFAEQVIVNALADQGIEAHDMEEAIQRCCIRMKILKKRDGKYFVTKLGVAGYYDRIKPDKI